MKQTAVEWLEDYIQKEINKHSYDPMNLEAIHTLNHIKNYACKQAKEMERDQKVEFGKKCFYEGFEKSENDDANCFTAWREAVDKLLPFK